MCREYVRKQAHMRLISRPEQKDRIVVDVKTLTPACTAVSHRQILAQDDHVNKVSVQRLLNC